MANPDRSVYDPPFDDDLMFDTVDEQETARGRPLMILLGIVVLLAFAGVVWVAYRQGVDHAVRSEPPLLAQDPGPTRVAPAEPQNRAVPDNPIYDTIGGAPAAAAPAQEVIAAAPEEPAALPQAAPPEPPPAASAEPTPDMTVAEIPPVAPSVRPAAPAAAIPSEIGAEAPMVDPLPAGSSLPPVMETPPPAPEKAPPAPLQPSAAEIAAAKAQKDRLAREAAAAKKAEAARIAEEKRLQQLAAVKPAAPPAAAPVASEEIAPAASAPAGAPARDASGRPTLLTPPSFDLTPPQGATPPAAETPQVAAASQPPGRSAIVPDESPAAAAPSGGDFVVQIGAFNSAEDAAASWKRIQGAYASALGGAAPEIRQTSVNGKTKYRLRATGYADRNAANSACNRLKSAGQQCFIAAR